MDLEGSFSIDDRAIQHVDLCAGRVLLSDQSLRDSHGEEPGVSLRAAVARCFPDGARIIAIPSPPDVVLAISWLLGSDPNRPQKRSKIIRLTIDAAVVENYLLASQALRADADARICATLREHLAAFDPDHARAPEQDPEVVPWRIGSAV